jgi:hypothetical protein
VEAVRRLDEHTLSIDTPMLWKGHRLREALRREKDVQVFAFCGVEGAFGVGPDSEPDAQALRDALGPMTCLACKIAYEKFARRGPS